MLNRDANTTYEILLSTISKKRNVDIRDFYFVTMPPEEWRICPLDVCFPVHLMIKSISSFSGNRGEPCSDAASPGEAGGDR